MVRSTLARRLSIALSNLIVDDWRLLTTWAPVAGSGGERAIAFALGWHLKGVMERSWDVDCEYNRQGSGDAAAVKRWLVSADQDRPPTITPDLIVHRRGRSGPDDNLVVIEIKKDDDGSEPRGARGSLSSILNIQQQFGYQHAVLLNLKLAEEGPDPHWTWVEFAERAKSPHEPVAVYGEGSLAALWKRGESEDSRRYPPSDE
jgi:hypothetical protein